MFVGGSWYGSTNATLSPYFCAEDLQMSGMAFHSDDNTLSSDSNALSRKGEHLLSWISSAYK